MIEIKLRLYIYLYIFPRVPLVCVSVCVSVCGSPYPAARTVGPTTLIFGMYIDLNGKLLIFRYFEVKGQGNKNDKICLFGPSVAIGWWPGWDRDWVGSGRLLLATCQLFLAWCQKP